jgi:hypothetical protein
MPPGASATRWSTTPTATSSRSTALGRLEIEDAPGEGAHGDAGAGGAVVVVGSPGGDGAPQRVALRSSLPLIYAGRAVVQSERVSGIMPL